MADQAIRNLPEGKEYHVFLAYASENQEDADKLAGVLKGLGFKLMLYDRDFRIGGDPIQEIPEKMEKSMRMVLLLTKESNKKNWPMYEAMQSLRKMIDENTRFTIVLRKGVQRTEVPKFIRWVPDVDYNNENWLKLLTDAITDSTPLEIGLQGNDVGFGMAYGYFYSYLNIIIPPQGEEGKQLDLKGRIEKYLQTKSGVTYMPLKIYILVPESGILPSNIANVDKKIELRDKDKDKLKTTVIRGGTPRPYMNMIRTIEDDSGVYQCLVEYATVIQPLTEMEDNPLLNFKEEDRILQVNIFFKTLEDIIRSFDADKRAMVELIKLSEDEESPLSTILLDRIKADMKK
ncbi:unnamed protein product [Owenia fusiformis]|uniref:Uncharacterized protein n=1 Tax=Owenia fusiformis TaxID=6347 RepID=A0A8J1Y3I9_OWEFU|nr:unnamed protein product [Owenia fusiformis]